MGENVKQEQLDATSVAETSPISSSSEEFDIYGVNPNKPYRGSNGSKDALLYLADRNKYPDHDEPPLDLVQSGGEGRTQTDIEAEAKALKFTQINEKTKKEAQAAAEQGDLTGVQKAVGDGVIASSHVQGDSTPEFNLLESPYVKEAQGRLEKSTYSILKKITERLAEDTGPGYEDSVVTWGGLGDVADMIFSSPVQAITGLPWYQSEAAEVWKNAVASGAPQDEIEAYENALIDYIADSGLLTNTNRFMLMSLTEDIKQGGVGVESDINKIFGAIDIAGVALAAPKVAKGAYNITRVARMTRGLPEATRIMEAAVDNPTIAKAAGVVEETTVSALKLPVTNYDQIAAPGVAISKQGSVYQRVRDLISSYRKINPVNFDALQKSLPKIVKAVRQDVDRMQKNVNVADVRVLTPDRDGNIVAEAVIGTSNGAPIQNKLAAQGKAKKLGNGAEIRKIEGEDAWYVVLPMRVGSKLALDEVTPEMLHATVTGISRLLNGTLSSVSDLPRHLDALAKQAEGVIEPFVNVFKKDIEAKLKAVKGDGVALVDAVFRDLRDGPDSHLREAWDEAGFREKFYQKHDRVPTDAEVDLYQTVQALNDVNYELKAQELMQTAANERFVWHVQLSDESGDVARYVDYNDLSRDAPVVDLTDGTVRWKEGDAGAKLDDKVAILELENAITLADGTSTRFVQVPSDRVRRAFASDFLNYNPGGVRDYSSNYSYVVKQDNDGDLVSVMGARSEKDAQKGAKDLNTVIDVAVAENEVLGQKNLTRQGVINALKSMVNNEALNRAIRENNGWNPAINSVKDLLDWMEEGHNLRFSEKIGVAGWDDPIRFTTATGAGSNATVGRTYGDNVFRAWNRPRNSTRKDTPLYGYGNDDVELTSPIDTILNDSMRTLHADAFRAYDEQAARATLVRAKELIPDKGEVERAERISVLKGVEVAYEQLSKLNNPGKDHRTYRVALKRILMQRDMKNKTQRLWEGVTARLAERLWDADKKGVSKWMHNISAQSRQNPIDWLRSRNFALRLGFFDPSQLIVQTAHLWNIVAISPKYGIQGALHSVPAKLYSEARTAAQRNLVLRNAAKWSGEDIEELRTIYEFIRQSGRTHVGTEVAEHGGMVRTSIDTNRSFANRALHSVSSVEKAGLVTFNVGESLPRASALYTAIKEYRKKFPNTNILTDDAATLEIIRRQDVLSGMMTRTSSGTLNRSGTLALPLQFMTYSMRMLETVLRGDLSRAERLRLFGAQIGFWGAGGVGLSAMLDEYALNSGMSLEEMTEEKYLILRNGLLGEMYNYAVGLGGGRLDISNRLQIGDGIWEAIKGVGQDSFVETFTGPGGQLIGDVFTASIKGMTNVYHGNLALAKSNVLETVRNISSFNRAYRSYATYYYGQYLSKKGEVVTDELTGREALGILLGATPEEVETAWNANQWLKGKKEFIKETKANIARLKVELAHAYEDGDEERREKLFNEMAFFQRLLIEAGDYDREHLIDALEPSIQRTIDAVEAYGRKTHLGSE